MYSLNPTALQAEFSLVQPSEEALFECARHQPLGAFARAQSCAATEAKLVSIGSPSLSRMSRLSGLKSR